MNRTLICSDVRIHSENENCPPGNSFSNFDVLIELLSLFQATTHNSKLIIVTIMRNP